MTIPVAVFPPSAVIIWESASVAVLVEPREAEVGDFRETAPRDEDVLGLQVPMDDALLVGGRESFGDLRRDVERVSQGGPPILESAQVRSLDEFGGEEDDPLLRPDVEHRHDVRIGDRGGGARFALEAGEALGVGRELRGEHLDRDLAAETGIASFVDLAHAPRTQRREDLVGAEAGSGGERHVRLTASPAAMPGVPSSSRRA